MAVEIASAEDSDDPTQLEIETIFKSKDELDESVLKLRRGDLYVVGKLWIVALKSVLVGAKFNLIPVVKAAKRPEVPQKPPSMKYKELPVYTSPHFEYKDYVACKDRCPEYDTKMLHQYLQPKIKNCRVEACELYCQAKCQIKNGCKDVYGKIDQTKKDVKKYMRDPENLPKRQGCVATGAVIGFVIGSGGGIPRRFFFTGLGILTTGALCFPKETDEGFRNFTYFNAKALIAVYNRFCGKNFSMRERLPCKDELPAPPKVKRKEQCIEKKKK